MASEAPVPDKKPILTGETKHFEFEISSTNDLSYPCFIYGFQLASNCILLLQLIVLIAIIAENKSTVTLQQNFSVRVGQIFVFIYLLYSSSGGLSISQKVKMRLSHTSHHNDERASMVMRTEATKGVNFIDEIANLFFFGITVMSALFWSCFALTKYCFLEVFCPQDSKYLGFEIDFIAYFIRLGGVALEAWVLVLTIIASIMVINSQTTLIDILFNFTGVMIVSSLDEVIMSAVPKYKIKLLVPNNFENEDPSATKDSVEMGIFMFSGFVLLLTMLASTKFNN